MLSVLRGLELQGFKASLSGAPFIEITGAGVSKASALAAMCADLGIESNEVMALGDAHNDLEMLRWAGIPVAPANAQPEVKAIATEITASNDDDGVALAIERVLAGLHARS